jgi:hypothetical protein
MYVGFSSGGPHVGPDSWIGTRDARPELFAEVSTTNSVALASETIAVVVLCALGAGAIASFICLAAHRIPRHESIVRPRSHCDACKKELAAYDMIPIVSYLLLSGRCRYCRAPIGADALKAEIAASIMGGSAGLILLSALR